LELNAAPSDYMRQVYSVLATIDMREGKLAEALAVLDRALLVFPAAEHLLYLRAECLHDLDRYAEARETLVFLINGITESQYHGGVPCDIKEKLAPRKLAEVLLLQHEYSAAESLLESVLVCFPEDTLSWHALGRVYLDLREQTKLMAVVERLRACPQGEIFSATLLVAWHMMRGELGLAGPLIDQLIGQAPQMPLPRLLRADWLARVQAPVDDRIHACRDVLRLLPGNPDANRMLSDLEAIQRTANQQASQRQTAPITPGDSCISLVIGAGMVGGTL
jgi:tetratricopeptide (TPR) repeat protein